jgi:hypothetical protein
VNAPHPGDLLSALADDALPPGEAAAVRAHVDSCPPCTAELGAVAAARRILRALPDVEPPFGFFERLLLRRRWRDGIAAVVSGTAAAAVMVALAIGPPASGSVTPAVSNLLQAHLVSLQSPSPPATVAAPDIRLAPVALADGTYRRVATVQHGSGIRVIYSNGANTLSLFEQPGELDVRHLPRGGEIVRIGSHPGVRYRWNRGELVVWQASKWVYALVAEAPLPEALDIARSVPQGPPPPRSLLDRIRGASIKLLKGF